MPSNKYSHGKRRLRLFPLLLSLTVMIFCQFPAPAMGAAEVKGEPHVSIGGEGMPQARTGFIDRTGKVAIPPR
jgi:hypothetical protein